MSWWKKLWEEFSHAPYQRYPVCEGSGKIKNGYFTTQCETCDGLGHIVPGQEKAPLSVRCSNCQGLGKTIGNQNSVIVCPICDGSGQTIPGKEKDPFRLACGICNGTGVRIIGSLTTKCTVCGGVGYLPRPEEKSKSTPFSELFPIPNWQSNTCPICNGQGWVEVTAPGTPAYLLNKTPKQTQVCGKCGGSGKI